MPEYHEDPWISLEDRMPDPGTRCLIYGEKRTATTLSTLITITSREAQTADQWPYLSPGWSDHVTHWMPIPDPPVRRRQESSR